MASPQLSIVIPVHNESANIAPLCERLLPVLERIGLAWGAIFVDDGSRDETWSLVKDLSRRDHRIGAVSFSRNFGKEIAIAAGLDHARGDAVVIMDADLQHPPEMIEAFVERWRQGYLMVYGQRSDRSRPHRFRKRSLPSFTSCPEPEPAASASMWPPSNCGAASPSPRRPRTASPTRCRSRPTAASSCPATTCSSP